MSDVLIVVKDDKLAGLLTTACRDRGASPFRALGPAQALEEVARPREGRRWVGLMLDLGYDQRKPLDLAREFLEAGAGLKIVALGKNPAVKTMSALWRLGAADFLEIPPDPLELSKCLDKFLGRLSPPASPVSVSAAYSPGLGSTTPGSTTRRSTTPEPAAVQAPAATASKGAGPRVNGPRAIIGRSAALKKLFRLADKAAASDSTVLIHGESGSGKELLARELHLRSPRAGRPLIPVNCGAIPEELLESELFGHEKGAFTNAVRTRLGRFEMADGGAIFLDEIGDMSPKLQVKLLRVLQEHEIERVGGDRIIPVDIRVIAATHVDLVKAVAEGRFREDLFYRLNVIPLVMPPLRERREDVPLLLEHFLARLAEIRGGRPHGINREALELLLAYDWPGNVRELENLVERMVTLADGPVLTAEDLPVKLRPAGGEPPTLRLALPEDPPEYPPEDPPEKEKTKNFSPAPEPDAAEPDSAEPAAAGFRELTAAFLVSLEQAEFPPSGLDFYALTGAYEEKLIAAALKAADGVKNQAARLLNLQRTTLVEKLKKKGLAGLEP